MVDSNYKGLSDKRAYLAVLGSLIQNPVLCNDPDRPISKSDFGSEKFYSIIFVSVFNLYQQGVEKMDEFTIDSYLSNFPEQYKIFNDNDGQKWVSDAMSMASVSNYDYYYHRMRKYSLLRYYEMNGLDTSFLFDRNKMDNADEQQKFDEYTEQEIINLVESKMVITPNIEYCSSEEIEAQMAGKGLMDLVLQYMEEPDVGYPLASPILTTLTRGCRMGCLFMRGSIQGGGKSRIAAMDACKIAVPYYWDIEKKEWVYTGISEPVVYITTEMENREIQTIFLACVCGINEEKIKYGQYEGDEFERIKRGNEIISQSPLILVHIPDFSIDDIKNVVKKYNKERHVCHFFFDYIFSSMKVMQNMGGKLGMRLQEHQFLLLFSNELKTLCQKLNVFMFTACQLNGEIEKVSIKDQNVLAGAKALANKLDFGCNILPPTSAELKKIEPITNHMLGVPTPNMVSWVYKCRSGKITRVLIWSYYDLGTLRCKDLFVTDYNFKLIDVDVTKIEIAEKVIQEHSVNASEVTDEEPQFVEPDEDEEVSNKGFNW